MKLSIVILINDFLLLPSKKRSLHFSASSKNSASWLIIWNYQTHQKEERDSACETHQKMNALRVFVIFDTFSHLLSSGALVYNQLLLFAILTGKNNQELIKGSAQLLQTQSHIMKIKIKVDVNEIIIATFFKKLLRSFMVALFGARKMNCENNVAIWVRQDLTEETRTFLRFGVMTPSRSVTY